MSADETRQSDEQLTPKAVHFLPYGSYVASCGRIEDERVPDEFNDERKHVTCSECQDQMTDLGDLPPSVTPEAQR